MDARESLNILMGCLEETGKRLPRQTLLDFVVGNLSMEIEKANLGGHELFGCGDKHDEEHYNAVLDQALKDNIIKQTGEELRVTQKGRRSLRSGTKKPYPVNDDEEQSEPDKAALDKVQRLGQPEATAATEQTAEHIGHHTKVKILLIQAMDRKLSLDDFAEQNNIGFDEVLDELEEMREAGRAFDVGYFLDEVMDKSSQQELFDCFREAGGDLAKVIEDMGDVYTAEEIRLAHLAWRK
ncbi:MAG: hypothetical protein LUI09_03830 [Prevotellaceae bacterium]|nr:hypothetical protein [Prevotellaceae bacterium]